LLILVTNDDGVHSEGLTALRDRLSKEHEVYVVAPERERTCVGHAITLHKPLRIKELESKVFSTNGTPVDAIFLGIKVLLPGKPDFVISGINKGPNMGQDVNYSGTVAAAKEGAFLGIPSIAFSVAARSDFLFEDATMVVEEVIRRLAGQAAHAPAFLNVNIPNIRYLEIQGFLVTRLGKRIYNDTVVERVDPRGANYYWIGGNGESYEPVEGTDFDAVNRGFVSVTPLVLDVTSDVSIENYIKYFRRVV
jgi:5'-nucleotidase